MNRRVLAAGAAALLAAGAGVAWLRLRPAVEVDVFEARKGRIEEIVTAVSAGTVKSRWEAAISAEAAGRVEEVRVDEGDSFRKGEVLLVLADPELQRRIEAALAEVTQAQELLGQSTARREEARKRHASDRARAESNLRKAREDHRRAAELFRGGFLSRADMDRADAALANAREDVELAEVGEFAVRAIDREIDALHARVAAARASSAALRERRRKLTVSAPFAGIVLRRTAERGEIKQPGAPLLVVADPRSIYIEASIDESESAGVREGQKARLYPDAYLGETFEGVVSEVKPTIEASREVSRANTIRVSPLSPPKPLRLGMSVDVEVLVGGKDNVLLAPSAAVMEREGRKFVYVAEDGKAIRKDVTTGISNWDWTEIVSGISAGDAVITSLEIKDLSPGSRIGIRSRE